MTDIVIDCSDKPRLQMFLGQVRLLEGQHRFSVKKYRAKRSDRQNRFYWPVFVQPFYEWLKDAGFDEVRTADDAHEMLKYRFLTVDIIDKSTGESIGTTVRSTATLDTKEFNEYLDRCAQFLAEFCGIVVPEPRVYHERP